ncbi:MAG: hypothetical protein QM765_41540 [Myxococcales bacterium]
MTAPGAHPSFLELDRAALGSIGEPLRQHLESCQACRSHVERVQQPLPVPAWIREEATRPKRRWLPSLAGSLAALATAAVAFFVLWSGPVSKPEVQIKGQAAVALFVKRGEQVRLWDGRSPVRPGDLLRLKVVPEGLGQVLVAVPTPDGGLSALYQGVIATREETLLPESWRVDDSAGPEVLAIALSAERIDVGTLKQALEQTAPRADLWTTVLSLQKETPVEVQP